MLSFKGLHYVVDDKGRKKAVIMSYKAYLELMEDLDDLNGKMERGEEKPEDFQKVLERLRAGKCASD